MKKNIFWSFLMMLVLALGTTVVFSSCSSDDDDNSSTVVGSWTGSIKDYDATETYQLVFQSNGTGVATMSYISKYGNETETFAFTYQMISATQGVIVTKEKSDSHPGGYDIDTYMFEIVGNMMMVYEIEEDGDRDLEFTLYKI